MKKMELNKFDRESILGKIKTLTNDRESRISLKRNFQRKDLEPAINEFDTGRDKLKFNSEELAIIRKKKIIMESGNGPKIGCWPSSSNQLGNTRIERSSTTTLARPRKPISIARVTTKEGSFMKVIQKPLNNPPAIPINKHEAKAVAIEAPASTIHPRAHAASPIIDATERSISALMMMKAMIKAMMTFSIDSAKRLI